MKKIFLFIAPLMSFIMLVGCFGGGNSLTYVNTKNLYANYIDSYITGTGENAKNQVFKFNTVKTGEVNDETDYTELNDELVSTFEKVMYITYSNTSSLQDEVLGNTSISGASSYKYRALNEVYQRMLVLIFNYYANHNGRFFEYIDQLELVNTEVNELFARLRNLQKETDKFIQHKESFEKSIFGLSSPIALGNLDNLYFNYNRLIEASLNFVNYFKDLHKTYFFPEDVVTESGVHRLVDEALLMLAEAIYYDNIKSFEEQNTVNIKGLYGEFATSKYNWILSEDWQKIAPYENYRDLGKIIAPYKNYAIEIEEDSFITLTQALDSEEYKEMTEELVGELYLYVRNFNQNLKNYKEIFKGTRKDYYRYARKMDNNVPPSFKVENLSVIEKSNILFMQDFSSQSISTMFKALETVINYNN